jgi:hypothetical protein
MGPADLCGIAFLLFLVIAPPILLFRQLRSGEVYWGHGFGFPRAKRSENPFMFWTLVTFEIAMTLALWTADIIIAMRGR